MLAAQARLEPGQNNILVLWHVLWDQTTCDEYPRFVLHRQETTAMTPAAPWESHSAEAHRKEKAAFSRSRISSSALPLLHVLQHILPRSRMPGSESGGNVAWAASLPVAKPGMVHDWLVLPDERGAPASTLRCRLHGAGLRSCPQDQAALARTKHVRADSPAWEIS